MLRPDETETPRKTLCSQRQPTGDNEEAAQHLLCQTLKQALFILQA